MGAKYLLFELSERLIVSEGPIAYRTSVTYSVSDRHCQRPLQKLLEYWTAGTEPHCISAVAQRKHDEHHESKRIMHSAIAHKRIRGLQLRLFQQLLTASNNVVP